MSNPVSSVITEAPLMRTEDLSKGYSIGGRRLEILVQVSIEIKRGEMVAVVRQSGAGSPACFTFWAHWTSRTAEKYILRSLTYSNSLT